MEVTLQDDGGTARGGADTTTAEFTIFLDPVPAARDMGIKHPWKADCIPVTLAGMDADTDPEAEFVWPSDPWPWLQAEIVDYPTHGFLTDYVSRPADAKGSEDNFWLFMYPTTPMEHYGTADHLRFNWNNTHCYVPLSSTFVGSDTYTYRVFDADGNVSNIALVTIEIFEVKQ